MLIVQCLVFFGTQCSASGVGFEALIIQVLVLLSDEGQAFWVQGPGIRVWWSKDKDAVAKSISENLQSLDTRQSIPQFQAKRLPRKRPFYNRAVAQVHSLHQGIFGLFPSNIYGQITRVQTSEISPRNLQHLSSNRPLDDKMYVQIRPGSNSGNISPSSWPCSQTTVLSFYYVYESDILPFCASEPPDVHGPLRV